MLIDFANERPQPWQSFDRINMIYKIITVEHSVHPVDSLKKFHLTAAGVVRFELTRHCASLMRATDLPEERLAWFVVKLSQG
jgi:hypothetical protein